jgi:hypothetical protein
MIRPDDLGAVLADVVAAIGRFDDDERARRAADTKTRTRIADACRVLHRLHAGEAELEEASDVAARPVRVVIETSLSGRPKRTIVAEPEAATDWDKRAWERR